MIDLTAADDPMLFRIELPTGELIVQWNEILACMAGKSNPEPSVQDVAAAIRKVARTPAAAQEASDEVLFAAFARIGQAVNRLGN